MSIIDYLGRKVFEGRIDETNADSEGVGIELSGYYSHAQEELHGIIYPAGVPVSASEIIEDSVGLAPLWSSDLSHILQTTADISPLDFSGEKKLDDAIREAMKYGSDDVIPRPLYFAIWDNRIPYFFVEPQIFDEPDWQIRIRYFSSRQGLSLNRSRRDVWNKIQVIYDDPDIGQTFTNFAEDEGSQKLFDVREGTVNIGSALPGVADTVRDLALNSYAYPIQSSSFGIEGRVHNIAGAPEHPYMVRAGSLVRINDYDASVSQLVTGGAGGDSAIAFVNGTRYNADRNTLTLQLGRRNVVLDLLMSRLGLGAGGVR
jgi:hypothetical protein